jgi:hypothetical protein
VLEHIKTSGDIFWAQSDRDWILDGAAVNISIVGFDDGKEKEKSLDGKRVESIKPDLTTSFDLTQAERLQENFGICFMGPSAKGPFEISSELAVEILNAPADVNGRPNSDVVRPVVNAADLVKESRDFWTIDFGVMPIKEAAQYELPFEYLKENVFPIRSKNRRAAYAEKWWQYAEVCPGMRKALEGLNRYIATPAVAKYRIFVWLQPEVLCNQRNLVFTRSDDYFFGILQSTPHELWSLRQGSTLEDRPSYTPTTTFETFPFPWAPAKEPKDDASVQAIAAAAKELVELRDRWLTPSLPSPREASRRGKSDWGSSDLGEVAAQYPQGEGRRGVKHTLTNLYNALPTWLDLAHKKLDEAVFAAYGWPKDLSDEEILEKLLALNLERAKIQVN